MKRGRWYNMIWGRWDERDEVREMRGVVNEKKKMIWVRGDVQYQQQAVSMRERRCSVSATGSEYEGEEMFSISNRQWVW
jgi:hypothetical protein